MTEVISVRFKNKGKVYFFDPAGIKVPSDVNVIVETSKGLEFAYCTWGNHWVDDNALVPPLRPVIRIATDDDIARSEENKKKEEEAFRVCQEKIAKHEIDMKLVDVEYNFEGTKILFFFTSDGRVDFRELVKDLASVFRTRIELRQIGVRDEAKMLGGLGICGKPFCCSQFLDEFHPVSIKMAKTQGLSLNPAKISGTCGRLMCCLKYEQVAYEDLVKRAPKLDAFVDTPGGKGSVMSVNLLRSYARVRLEDSGDTMLKTYAFDELEVLGGKARRAEYIAARDEGRLEEAGFTPSQIRESKIEQNKQLEEENEAPFIFADGTVASSKHEQEANFEAETEPGQTQQKNRNSRRGQNKKQKQHNNQANRDGADDKHSDKEQNSKPRNSANGQRQNRQPQQKQHTEKQEQQIKQRQKNRKPTSHAGENHSQPTQEKAASADKKRSRYYNNKKRRNNKHSADHKTNSAE